MAHDLSKPTMVTSDKTAREIFEEVRANPARARFGFGEKLAIVNVDPSFVRGTEKEKDLFRVGLTFCP